mmetsp:Transcript_27832/g.56021  ORF Transcript_27832/g.56021 Transcript_27832/m.56021 type:complete len:180 (-) Transcript_27832:37-576(-)
MSFRATFSLLLICSFTVELVAITCYVSNNVPAISAPPELSVRDCHSPMGTTQLLEDQFNFVHTDDEVVKNSIVCSVSCNGKSRESGTCAYGCVRFEACIVMQNMMEELQQRDELAAAVLTEASDEALEAQTTPYRYRFHSCCSTNRCNMSKASPAAPAPSTLAVLLLSTVVALAQSSRT